jgi:hypothetical protein
MQGQRNHDVQLEQHEENILKTPPRVLLFWPPCCGDVDCPPGPESADGVEEPLVAPSALSDFELSLGSSEALAERCCDCGGVLARPGSVCFFGVLAGVDGIPLLGEGRVPNDQPEG